MLKLQFLINMINYSVLITCDIIKLKSKPNFKHNPPPPAHHNPEMYVLIIILIKSLQISCSIVRPETESLLLIISFSE